MESVISNVFLHNWQRKVVALIAALIIWLFVNQSITDTKTIPNVPIRITNLPADKTVLGLQPNGILSKRINLTLSGSKDVIDELEPGDLEVNLDASMANQDEWIVQINKKNLVSLNPNIDLAHHITAVNHTELVIKFSRLITAKIPINILPPVGEPPPGYEYLDLWPQRLTQTLSGPEEEIQKLKEKGFDLTFDLSDIRPEELANIKKPGDNSQEDEIRFLVPNKWKQVAIPFHNHTFVEINDPEAQYLRIYFLRKQILPLEKELPLAIFFPLQTSDTLNPETLKIAPGKHVKYQNNIPYLSIPLFVKDVSHLFLNIVRDNLQLTLIATPPKERENLEWSLEVISAQELEDTYLAYLVSKLTMGKTTTAIPKKRELLIRKRFRDYVQRLTLYVNKEQPLDLESFVEENKIIISGD